MRVKVLLFALLHFVQHNFTKKNRMERYVSFDPSKTLVVGKHLSELLRMLVLMGLVECQNEKVYVQHLNFSQIFNHARRCFSNV